MKKLFFTLTLLLTLSFNSCTQEDQITGNLNIPEEFRGNWQGGQSRLLATVTSTFVQVEGHDIFNQADSETFNGFNYYRAKKGENDELILTRANGLIGISIYRNGILVVNDFFGRQ